MLTMELTQLGPARVDQVAGNRVRIDRDANQHWARMALAFPYQPAVGDEVLVAGQGEDWYVIGVLAGTGVTRLTVPADLELHAPRGSIELRAGRGIRLRAPTVQVTAKKIRVLARQLVERLDQASRTVSGAVQVCAGRLRTAVRTTYRLLAGRIVERSEDDVKIDGQKIHLG